MICRFCNRRSISAVCPQCQGIDTGQKYTPTPDEIQAYCRALQAGWTPQEARKRAGVVEEVLTVMEVQTDHQHRKSSFATSRNGGGN